MDAVEPIGVRQSTKSVNGISKEKPKQALAILLSNFSLENQLGFKYTVTAPAVTPNIATEIEKKARWYQFTTLNKRVSIISNASVVEATRNVPK